MAPRLPCADGRPLAARTAELYRYQLDRFLLPALATRPLRSIHTEHVRDMHAGVCEQASTLQAAKAYRVLRVILNTAVEDERITHNPCKLRGAGGERSPERPFVDADLVLALAVAIDERYSCLVLLAGFGGLRLGELLALRRHHIDLDRHTVAITVQTVELKNGDRLTTAPKTDAGRRVVHLPAQVAAALAVHLERYVGPDGDALLFTGPRSSELRRATFYTEWDRAVRRSVSTTSTYTTSATPPAPLPPKPAPPPESSWPGSATPPQPPPTATSTPPPDATPASPQPSTTWSTGPAQRRSP